MDIEWSSRDIERRAARVLLELIERELSLLPSDAATWLEHLPVTTTSRRQMSSRPLRPTDWAATARRFRWPPQAFIGHSRSRVKDESALQVLVWVARRLDQVVRDVRVVAPLLVGRVETPVVAMAEIATAELAGVEAIRPDRLDLRALASSGRPWSALTTIAESLMRAETDLEFLAFELIEPDPDLEWRLFHLSVLGEIIAAVRQLGGRVRWNAPLSASESSGPQFHVTVGQARWDLWFEASAAFRYYTVTSPYKAATAGVRSAPRSIGADVMLCLPGKRALMLECKWSAFGSYVGRDGYHQASSYLVEARSGLVTDAWSYIVGPGEIVPERTEAELNWPEGVATVGVCNIQHLGALIRSIIFISDGQPET
ncbi:MAG: hypothetical protein M0030_20700 [Actinomycetota bacterium]|nr:hypothetical protein [Actinomycetota bacterium]